MIRFSWMFLFLLTVSLLTAGCKKETIPEDMPDIGISVEEMNTQVRLAAPLGWNTFKTNDIVNLTVEVIGSSLIAFAEDYGAKMFIHEGEEWLEVGNDLKYQGGGGILSPAKNDRLKFGQAAMVPILPDPGKPVVLRVILIGNIYKDGQVTEEKTAAYIDVKLEP